jgi:long-chain acyl-CoA synthetase
MATMQATGLAPPATPPIPVGLVTTPLFHVTANNCGAYATAAAGGTMVLMYKWDALEALKLIEREKITSAGGVPVMARELISHPDFARYDTSSLMTVGGGGAPLQPDLVKRIDAEVATARPNTGYGMTETCGIITAVSGDFFVDRPASVGPAMPTFEVKCVDDDGNTLPEGEVGELWVRGASVIKGYLNRPEATAESITDGWLHTGDVARIDADGFIFIVDRKKDMVLRGGENVYCAEVEAAVHHHPAVAECCVFGVPDPRLGEDVAAAVVLRDGYHLTAEALRAHCADHLARHKIPRNIWFLTEPLPRNANGKFLKRELREKLGTVAAA